jgi:putative hydrolase of the HAD superfamily
VTIRAVIFDLGHTIWDIGPIDEDWLERRYRELHATVCERLGRDDLPSPAEIRAAVWQALRDEIPRGFMTETYAQPPSHVWVGRGCRAVGLELEEALLREISPPLFSGEIDRLICADGTLEAVRDLADAGYALGCVTNTLTDGATIRAMLRRYGFEALMRSVVVSADEGWAKPHPSLFLKAARDLGVAPEDALFVGDSPFHDIGGAKNAGMRAVLTQQYAQRPYEDVSPQPDAIIQHVRELRELIARLDEAGVSAATER